MNKKKRENNKIHDSIIKDVLEEKEEFRDFIRTFYNIEVEEEKLELQNKEYRTRFGLRTRYIDVLYKIKGEETYIILEHQSTVDYAMSERIGEYCLAVVRSRRRYMLKSRNRMAPLVYPIVLSTAKKVWDATRTIKQDEGNLYKLPVQKYPEYPLFEGERYVGLGYKYQLIDQDYSLLTLNEPLVVVEYQDDGSSRNMYKQYWKNPKGFAFIRKSDMRFARSFRGKFKACIHYVSHSLRAKNTRFINESPLPLLTILAVPFGIVLYIVTYCKVKSCQKIKI